MINFLICDQFFRLYKKVVLIIYYSIRGLHIFAFDKFPEILLCMIFRMLDSYMGKEGSLCYSPN